MASQSSHTALSGVVVAFNEADRIGRCVRSLQAVCDEIIVVDAFSTDATARVAREAGARVIERRWNGFADQKNFAVASAQNPWVLLLDADEWLAPEAAERISSFMASGRHEGYDAIRLPRHNRFLGKRLRHGSWGSDHCLRLFRVDLRYERMRVHERLLIEGKRVGGLDAAIDHESVRSVAEQREKLVRYAALGAAELWDRGKRARPGEAVLRAGFHFMRNYLLRGGFLDGAAGLQVERLNAFAVYEKYRILGGMKGPRADQADTESSPSARR
jgi:(heptosyl)LPS beta-1,4-glucosyltransferase